MSDERDGLPPDVRQALAVIEAFRAAGSQAMPVPHNRETGDQFDRRMVARRFVTGDRDIYEFPPHLREWFDGIDREDVGRLSKLLRLEPKTVEWIAGKNEKELQTLDDAVEFVSSSRTAAKVLMWVTGLTVSVVTSAYAFAKFGYDLFATTRGGPR